MLRRTAIPSLVLLVLWRRERLAGSEQDFERGQQLRFRQLFGDTFPRNSIQRATLAAFFRRPTSGGIKWSDIEALLRELGAEVTEREGSRIGVKLFGERRVFHRPHPFPDTDKDCVRAIGDVVILSILPL